MKLHPYSVMLLYPHDHDDDPETFFEHVQAVDPRAAAEHVRTLAGQANDGFIEPGDFDVLAVFPGHIDQL